MNRFLTSACSPKPFSLLQVNFSFVLIFILGNLSSCSLITNQHLQENDITFDSIQIEKVVPLINGTTTPNCQIDINFKYPTNTSNKNDLKLLQKYYILSYFGEAYQSFSPEEAITSYVDNYVKNYKSMAEDFQKELKHVSADMSAANWYSYYLLSENNLIYNAKGIISFNVETEYYTGGAHPLHTYTNHAFSLKEKKQIEEKDLFMDDYQNELAKIIVDKLVQQNKLSKPAELENIGFFSVDEIVPNGNFLANENGLLYSYAEYEIAPYVLGQINVLLPYDEIRHLFKDNNPLISIYR